MAPSAKSSEAPFTIMALLYLGAVSWAPASACQVGVRTPHLPPTMLRMSAGAEADALSAKDAEIHRLRKEMEEMQAQLARTQDATARAIEEARESA